jgi:outer membrane receptor protein involved in Fe transport
MNSLSHRRLRCSGARSRRQAAAGAAVVGAARLCAAPASLAQSSDDSGGAGTSGSGAASSNPLEEVVVFGRNTELLGTADAASEGAVGGADLSVRPLLRTAELLEAVPGLIAAQHSGSGKANQYFLRGFNLDHGTDFTTRVDGMPWNLRSHGHGQGYLDVNGLMPETVERIEYRKGPYRADVGDFAMAGSSFISTVDRFEQPFVSVENGQYGWGRLAGGFSEDVGAGVVTGAGQLETYDGPWELAENLQHELLWSKYTRPADFGNLAVSLSRYHATWQPTEQIPERVIGSSVCADEYCALDSTAVGETLRWIATAQLTGTQWDATAYAQYYDWHMLSNPTYDYQIGQFDRRSTMGGHGEWTAIESANLHLNVGGEFRYDDIGKVGVNHTEGGQFIENIGDNTIREGSFAVFAETTWFPTDNLRLFAGLRGDRYDFDVTAHTPGSFAGHVTDSAVSPKLGLAYTVSDRIELYGNWGRGFHSNDARGVVNDAAPVPGLAEGTGYEAGARFELGALKLTSAYWWLNLDSELKFVGDSNSVEPFGASRREGYEVTFFWRPIDWLGIDAVYTGSRARYVDNPDGPYIEQSVEHAGEIGLSGEKDPWQIGVRLRYLGPYALRPDDSLRAGAEKMLNLRGAYDFGKFTVYAELLNALGRHGKDIVYDYPAYVQGFDPPGLTSADIDCATVNCRMSRAEEPRTVRLGLKVNF